MDDIPYGYCKCGCGEKTLAYARTRPYLGYREGDSRPYIQGHQCRGRRISDDRVATFWSRIDIKGPDDCWLWDGGRRPNNYGHFWARLEGRKNPEIPSHVYAAILTKGPVPAGLQVNHHCDVPACCNPHHLYYGTAKDNTRDAMMRGRQVVHPEYMLHGLVGEMAPRAKLSTKEVIEICRLFYRGVRPKAIAAQFNMSDRHVRRIAKGKGRPDGLPNYLAEVQP